MDPDKISVKSDVRSPRELLSGKDLMEIPAITSDFSLISRGLKTKEPKFTKEENETVEDYKENLRLLLGLERVAPSKSRSFGIYEPQNYRIRVERNEGKWHYGFKENTISYLHPHEALYLMEMNRLEVEYNSVSISIEQAFAIFLDPQKNSLSLPQYIIYSRLLRFGYVVYKHDPQLDKQIFDAESLRREVNMKNELIWNCFMEKMNLPVQSIIIEKDPQQYQTIKSSMNKLSENIKDQESSFKEEPLLGEEFWKSSKASSSTLKKKVESMRSQSNSKRIKFYTEAGSSLDVLKAGKTYQEFKDVFEKIDIVQKMEMFEDNSGSSRDLKFDFDVFQPNTHHKRSDLPDYRLIVLSSTDGIPKNAELLQLYQKQHCKVPIILIIAYETCSLHCYIYDF